VIGLYDKNMEEAAKQLQPLYDEAIKIAVDQERFTFETLFVR